MSTTRHDPITCPNCFYEMDASKAIEGDGKPSPGNYCFCLKCGFVLVYGEGLSLWVPLPVDLANMPDEARSQLFKVALAWTRLTGKLCPALGQIFPGRVFVVGGG